MQQAAAVRIRIIPPVYIIKILPGNDTLAIGRIVDHNLWKILHLTETVNNVKFYCKTTWVCVNNDNNYSLRWSFLSAPIFIQVRSEETTDKVEIKFPPQKQFASPPSPSPQFELLLVWILTTQHIHDIAWLMSAFESLYFPWIFNNSILFYYCRLI